jgi:beta-glucosidase
MSAIASQSEVCIVCVSVFLVEGWDRENLRLDKEGEELIKVVEKNCAGKVVVVMHIGGQVIVEDWVSLESILEAYWLTMCQIDLPNIGAVLFAGYPGRSTALYCISTSWLTKT